MSRRAEPRRDPGASPANTAGCQQPPRQDMSASSAPSCGARVLTSSACAAPTIRQVLAAARRAVDPVDARVLLRQALQVGNEYLAAHPERELDAEQEHRFSTLVARRAAGEPVAYITERREFYGLEFKVTPDVLIPRPETELLVELALARVPERRGAKVLDLGTGSGAIAVSLAHHRPLVQVAAIDASQAALAVASENARRLLVQPNVETRPGNWYGSLRGETFSLIVANPPYVAAADPHLLLGDLRLEPRAALAAGADGLDDLRVIVAGAPTHLNSGGWLLCEHGYDQAHSVRELFIAAGFGAVFCAPDLAGIPRVTGGQWQVI